MAWDGPTFAVDDSLPDLPLPELGDTLEKYLESVRPFLDDQEFEHTRAVARPPFCCTRMPP